MNISSFRSIPLTVSATGAFVLVFTTLSAADSPLEFNRDIRPILTEHCFACHGPDSASRKGDLRLDQRDAAIGRNAIVPGQITQSELIRRIETHDADEIMPPMASKKPLSVEQIETLKRWVTQGAEYQPHWSFLPPIRPKRPVVKDQAWVKNPIDAFVLAQLEAKGLTPAPEADRRTLARRLSLDLTGLPPTPEMVERFLADNSPNAYETLVDALLETPQWGEHRGRYWLDAARYADTHGIHFDNFREMWSYRENVIEAFNRNQPFDQFTIDQLAGDLLPNRTLDQQIASGFNRCNITTNEGGTIPEEYYVLYARDRTDTVAQVWMGLTAGCAVCHNHKFDPLSQREFYELAAFFNNTTQNAMDGNIKDTPPVIVVAKEDERPRFAAVVSEIGAVKQAIESRRTEAKAAFESWLSTATPDSLLPAIPSKNLALHAPLNEGQGQITTVRVDGASRDLPLKENQKWMDGVSSKALELDHAAASIPDAGDFERDQPFSYIAWVNPQPNDSTGAIIARMDKPSEYRGWDMWLQSRRIGTHIVSSWPNDALKVVTQKQMKPNEWTHVAVTYDGSSKGAGIKIYYNGILQGTNIEVDRLQGSIRTPVPFRIGERSASDPVSATGIQDLRLYRYALSATEVESLAKVTRFTGIFAKAPADRTEAEKAEVYPWWLGTIDQPFQQRTAQLASLESEHNAIKARGTVALVMNEKSEEAVAYILARGEYDKRGDQVKPSTPAALSPFPANAARNRLGLAEWLLDPAHPLMARVTVNRFWQELFGTGIVRTAGDFGIAGELPSNQELLDWLAIEFREGTPELTWPASAKTQTATTPWDIKRFFRLLVTSNTYRQAAVTTPLKLEKDLHNRLLSRGPRFRMDAEMLRDSALAMSGLLVKKIGGPSVKPYQPDGVWEAVAMKESNTHNYVRDHGENLYRRSLYTFWKRSAPPASMEIFNATARETCTVRRERTNTPLQALVTLNDTQFVEAARNLAERALKVPATDETTRLNFVAGHVLSRPFRSSELGIVQQSLMDLKTFYQSHAEDAVKLIGEGESKADPSIAPAELAAWTMLANEIMNLDEALNK